MSFFHADGWADSAFLKRLLDYYEPEVKSRHYGINGICEFAPGVIGISDTFQGGEFDVFFDVERWGATMPELWGETLTPPGLAGTGMGVLPGIGSAPPPRSLDGLFRLARRHLQPLKGDAWHEGALPSFPVPESLRSQAS